MYYLLGHRPVLRGEVYGRPLFTEAEEEQREYRREWWLVASSYAAVYGVLGDGGKSLYIADGVNRREYFFELGVGARRLEFGEYRRRVREGVEAVGRFYGFGGK